MSKKKFDNVVVTLQTNKVGFEKVFSELTLLFSKDYIKIAKDFLQTHSLAIALGFSLISFGLILVNILFLPLLVFGLVKIFDFYKFYLIKKDFEENGIF